MICLGDHPRVSHAMGETDCKGTTIFSNVQILAKDFLDYTRIAAQVCCEPMKNILDGILLGERLIHLKETGDAVRFGSLTGHKTVCLHDGAIVVLMGFAEFRWHSHVVI